MASRSSEPSADPAKDLGTFISEGTVDEEVLQLYAERGQLDIPDKEGRTPLMLACLKGLEDAVKFLLSNGVNPNCKCLKEGNTPLHYACTVEESKEEDALSGRYYSPSKWVASKMAIIKLLVGSGAPASQVNMNGWSPPCVAALYILKDVVDFFLLMDDAEIPLEENIKAIEILGVSQATIDERFCFETTFEDIFDSFSRAISLRQDESLPKAQAKTSDLAACFSKISLHECLKAEDLESIKACKVGVKAHAFLVGDRLFPPKLKQKYLYPSLANFGCDLMAKLNTLKDGRQILSCAIGFEHVGELKLGSVVGNLADKSGLFIYNDQYLQDVRDLLCEYESVLHHVHIDSLSDHSDCMIESFGEILFNEAFHCSTVDILHSTLQAIEKLVRIIRGRIRKENPDKDPELSSVTWKVMCLLAKAFVDNVYCGISSSCLLRVKYVIRKILFCDSACSLDRNDGNTLLHLVIYSMSVAKDQDLLEDLASVFVRHGCPIDVVNKDGQTAKDILEQIEGDNVYDPESDPLFLTLVSPPTTVLTLEEATIRAILRHNVIYKGKLPPILCAMIEGGLKDSDLVRGEEESDSNEDSGSDEESDCNEDSDSDGDSCTDEDMGSDEDQGDN